MEISPLKADLRRRLVFKVGQRQHEIDADRVLEVVRIGHITRVPNGPAALIGIANLRGRPMPILSMGRLISGDEVASPSDGKVIVYDQGGAVGLLVDDVLKLSDETTAIPLDGLDGLVDAAFKTARRTPLGRVASEVRDRSSRTNVTLRPFLTFRVAEQLCGLPLERVREIAMMQDAVAVLANGQESVIGLISLRGSVRPLISLASLMGLESNRSTAETRIVVVEHGGDLIGLVVGEMDVILRLPEQDIDTVPAILQRGRGDAQIAAIGRVAEGGRLISILSPEKLFGHDEVAKVIEEKTGAVPMETAPDADDAVEHFLIFQLGEETYGLPIVSVDEVIRVPTDVTRMPGAPSFVAGVINLRGRAIPLIDQRSRFDSPVSTQISAARAIVVTIGRLQAGFVVDAVSEIKALPASALSAAPEFSSDQTDVFDRIAHIEADGRMVLLVDPQELLTNAERDVVAAITEGKADIEEKTGSI
ncbi:chemotaxis protein [Rhizobium sp. Root708]|uniref:chemotaxis protein CheW n=1 Tax=Rhizobium sp. Root708 TaxID=1736592 RepID=UPI0007016968|nr:chemotaxis protein CheW [Rhizobium sp. Root708]KRB49224.1 chemotaxis protein [Rhizobium sp. Root708]